MEQALCIRSDGKAHAQHTHTHWRPQTQTIEASCLCGLAENGGLLLLLSSTNDHHHRRRQCNSLCWCCTEVCIRVCGDFWTPNVDAGRPIDLTYSCSSSNSTALCNDTTVICLTLPELQPLKFFFEQQQQQQKQQYRRRRLLC